MNRSNRMPMDMRLRRPRTAFPWAAELACGSLAARRLAGVGPPARALRLADPRAAQQWAGRDTGGSSSPRNRIAADQRTTPLFVQLLECPAKPAALADLLVCRWRRGGSIYWKVAAHQQFRDRFPPDAEDVWSHLLLSAIDELAWSPSAELQSLTKEFVAELEGIERLQFSMRQSLDRVDLLRSVTAGWRICREARAARRTAAIGPLVLESAVGRNPIGCLAATL